MKEKEKHFNFAWQTVNTGNDTNEVNADEELDADWADIAKLSMKSWTKDNPY